MGDDRSDDGAPPDPFTALTAAAAQVHEVFVAYKDAGFTAEQAIYLTGVVLAAGLRGAPGGSA